MQKDLMDFLLTTLRPRPGMFLTAFKLSYLEIYLTGVTVTSWELDKSGKYLDRFSGKNGFLEWSWKKYNLINPAFTLHHYLTFTGENEEEALNLFFNDLQVFASETVL